MKIGINYHLQFRMIIEDLQKQLDKKNFKVTTGRKEIKKI